VRLLVDWAACDGRGLCAMWAPRLIGRDEWGYPVVAQVPLEGDLLQEAKQAARSCPRLAIRLVPPR
jgi:ferredoxin